MARYINCELACAEVDKGDLLVGNNAEWAKEIIYRTPAADVVDVVHGQWELYDDNEDGYSHHRCSNCKEDAIFTYESEDMYDEGYDGEWHYIGDICVGIDEHLTKFCPHCGTKMEVIK